MKKLSYRLEKRNRIFENCNAEAELLQLPIGRTQPDVTSRQPTLKPWSSSSVLMEKFKQN